MGNTSKGRPHAHILQDAPKYGGKMVATAALISPSPARVLLDGYDIGVGNADFDKPPMLAETLTATDSSRTPTGMHTLKRMI